MDDETKARLAQAIDSDNRKRTDAASAEKERSDRRRAFVVEFRRVSNEIIRPVMQGFVTELADGGVPATIRQEPLRGDVPDKIEFTFGHAKGAQSVAFATSADEELVVVSGGEWGRQMQRLPVGKVSSESVREAIMSVIEKAEGWT
jgi:hypothetical protein